MDDRQTDKQQRMLLAMPREFREVATWAWTELRPRIDKFATEHGMNPIESAHLAARLSRLVVTQMYGDISRARVAPKISRN